MVFVLSKIPFAELRFNQHAVFRTITIIKNSKGTCTVGMRGDLESDKSYLLGHRVQRSYSVGSGGLKKQQRTERSSFENCFKIKFTEQGWSKITDFKF